MHVRSQFWDKERMQGRKTPGGLRETGSNVSPQVFDLPACLLISIFDTS